MLYSTYTKTDQLPIPRPTFPPGPFLKLIILIRFALLLLVCATHADWGKEISDKEEDVYCYTTKKVLNNLKRFYMINIYK